MCINFVVGHAGVTPADVNEKADDIFGHASLYALRIYDSKEFLGVRWQENKSRDYRRKDRAIPLYISIRIEFYNGIVRFLCHSTDFLLVFVCRLQRIICQKVTSTRKNQSVHIVNADK